MPLEDVPYELPSFSRILFQDVAQQYEIIGESEFPFAWRAGQKELAGQVYKKIRQGSMLFIQAPQERKKETLFFFLKAMRTAALIFALLWR